MTSGMSACEKYEPSAISSSKADSSRDLLREGFVEIGVIASTGVQDVELWTHEDDDGEGASTSASWSRTGVS